MGGFYFIKLSIEKHNFECYNIFMKLYRYLSKEELENLLAGKIEQIGHFYEAKNYKRVNTHKYKKGIKYLHFYFDEKEISRIKDADFHKSANYYICEFEIPFYVIFPHIGVGRYDGVGYEVPLDSVFEVALPAQKMKVKYLKDYKKDNSRRFSVTSDLLFGENKEPFKFDSRLFEPMYFDDVDNKKEARKEKTEQPLTITAFESKQSFVEEREL